MSAASEFAPGGVLEEDDDAVRTLMSAWLSGAHSERSCLEYAASLYRARPETAAKMLSLVVRYRGLGRITGTQYQHLTTHIEKLMAGAERPVKAPAAIAAVDEPGESGSTHDLNEFLSQAEQRERAAPAPTRTSPPAASVRDSARALPQRATDTVAAALGSIIAQRYQLQLPLNRGVRASVYHALDLSPERLGLKPVDVAIKLSARHSAGADDTALAREFQAAQRLSHPNIINVYDCDADTRFAFYTMELLEGETLHLVLRRIAAAPPRRMALTLIRELAQAMAHAHARGVVHQDLKPHNILLLRQGGLRVLDFGGAINATREREPWISDAASEPLFRPASPAYASCQQLEGLAADARDDIYALACIAYQVLSGRHPFEQLSALEARSRGLRATRPRALSAPAWRALRRGLAWERAQRPSSVEDWLADWDLSDAPPHLPPLEQLTALPPKSRSSRALLWGVVMIALLVGGGLLAQQQGWFLSNAPSVALGAPADSQGASTPPLALTSASPIAPTARASGTPAMAAPVALAPTIAASIAAARGNAVVSAAPEQSADAKVVTPAGSTASATAELPQLGFAKTSITVAAGEPAARVVIRRSGDTHSDQQFMWWTEDGSAKAGADYASLGRKIEHFAPGEDTVTLYVPVISGIQGRQSTQFDVLLSPDTSRDDGPSERATVTLRPSGD